MEATFPGCAASLTPTEWIEFFIQKNENCIGFGNRVRGEKKEKKRGEKNFKDFFAISNVFLQIRSMLLISNIILTSVFELESPRNQGV